MTTQSSPSNPQSPTDGKVCSTHETDKKLEDIAARLRKQRERQSDEPSKLAENMTKPSTYQLSDEKVTKRQVHMAGIEKRDWDEKVACMLAVSNIPRRHMEKINQQVTWSGDGWAVENAKLSKMAGTGYLALITGKRGTGKTQMGANLIVSSCRKKRSAMYVKAMSFFLAVRETYSTDGDSEKNCIDRYRGPKLLVLDEVHVRGESQWEDNLLTHLVDCRYDDGSDTILLSNLDKAAFIQNVGSSIADRARESGGVIVFDWPSYRGMAS